MKKIFLVLACSILFFGCSKKSQEESTLSLEDQVLAQTASQDKEAVSAEAADAAKKEVKGFVFTDKLKIRNAPSLESETIGLLVFGDEITYSGISGSGEYKNGILDKWVKISDTEEKWVNYLYVISFDIPLDMPCLENIIKNNETILNVYDELPNRIFIEDIETKDSKKYFKFALSDESYYHPEDYKFEKEVEPIIKNIYPPSFQQALKRGAGGKTYCLLDDVYKDMTSDNYVEELPENAVYDPETGLYTVNDDETVRTLEDLDTLTVLNNPSFRKFQFCEYLFSNYGRVTKITEDKGAIEYGIRIGMPVEELYEILGKPVKTNGNILNYFGDDSFALMELFINTSDGKISSISYEHYK